MAAPTFAPALGLVDAAGVPISATNPLSVSLVAGGGGTAVSIADGADVALGSLTDSSSALTVNGLLKAIKALLGAPLAVTGSFYQATQPVSAAALPLPSGAATAAKQPALGTAGTASTDVLSVQGIAGGIALPVSGTFWQTTQPVSGTVTANAGSGTFIVSAASLPLPSGAATSALQTTGNTSLANLDVALSTLSLKNQFPTTLGITTKAGSLSVALASDQVGTAGSASTTVFSVQGIGGGTALPVTVSNAFALDTSVSGILVAQASTTSGQLGPLIQGAVTTAAPSYTTTKTSPLSLDLAGNLRIVQVAESSSTAGVASSATDVTLLAANTSRKGASIYNASTAILYVQEGGAASIASGGYNVAIPASGYYELPTPVYKGVLHGIWASANGYAQVKENT